MSNDAMMGLISAIGRQADRVNSGSVSKDVNVTIKLNGLTASQRSRLDDIVSDNVIDDMEMQEILTMKLRPGMIETEKRRLEHQRQEVEAMRQEELAYQKSRPPTSKIKEAMPPMSTMTRKKLTWLAIVGPIAMASLAMMLIGLL